MAKIESLKLELVRPGKRHGQLLSKSEILGCKVRSVLQDDAILLRNLGQNGEAYESPSQAENGHSSLRCAIVEAKTPKEDTQELSQQETQDQIL